MNYNIWISITITGIAMNKRTCKHQGSKTFYVIWQQGKRLPNYLIWKLKIRTSFLKIEYTRLRPHRNIMYSFYFRKMSKYNTTQWDCWSWRYPYRPLDPTVEITNISVYLLAYLKQLLVYNLISICSMMTHFL